MTFADRYRTVIPHYAIKLPNFNHICNQLQITFVAVNLFLMEQNFHSYLLDLTQSAVCEEVEVIQSLWSGYGKIARWRIEKGRCATVVVKHIDLSRVPQHPRGWNTDTSHNRKVKSYEVETNWYEQWSAKCDDGCRIPKFIGSLKKDNQQWIVLEDLDDEFPIRKQQLSLDEVKHCLTWLAQFHGKFLGASPKNLWPIGTYWHLATRPDELNKIDNQEIKEKAAAIDAVLNQANHKTIVHGDAKLANFCFSEDGLNVAAVDFQYVGGGCGMKDVAYFLGSCLTGDECQHHENELLNHYFMELKKVIDDGTLEIDSAALEQEWRYLYPFACADFTRFLLGWMPTHQKVNAYNQAHLQKVLASL